MLETYANLLKNGLTTFLRNTARQDQVENEEDLRLVVKIQKGDLGAYLYNGSKYVRKVSFIELVKILF